VPAKENSGRDRHEIAAQRPALPPDAAGAGVDAVAPLRGRDYAQAVVTARAIAVRGSHRIPLFSTSWDNLPS